MRNQISTNDCILFDFQTSTNLRIFLQIAYTARKRVGKRKRDLSEYIQCVSISRLDEPLFSDIALHSKFTDIFRSFFCLERLSTYSPLVLPSELRGCYQVLQVF